MKTTPLKKDWVFLIPFLVFFTEKASSDPYKCTGNNCVLEDKTCQQQVCLSANTINSKIESAAANPSDKSPLSVSEKFFLTERLLPKRNPDGINWGNSNTTPSNTNASDLRGPFGF